MKKLKLFSLLMLLFVGVTCMWATDAVTTFANKPSGTWAQNLDPLPCETGGNAWSTTTTVAGWDSNDRGLQFTCTANTGVSVSLSSSDFQDKIIKSVSVVVSRNKAYDITLSATVNGNTLGSGDTGANNTKNGTLTTSDNTGINCSTGDIVITLSTGAPAKTPGSLYIKSITITYIQEFAVTVSNPDHGTISVMDGDNPIGAKVQAGKTLDVSVTGTGYTFTPRAYKTGDEGTAVTITNGKLTMPAYAITITADEEASSTPEISASVAELDWGRVAKGALLSAKQFTIEGANLTAGNLSLEFLNGNESNFTVSPTSIPVNGTLAATTITVTPKSSESVNTLDDILMISGGGASELDIDIKLTVLETYTVDWYINEVKKGTQTDTVGAELTNIPDATLAANGALSGKEFLGWTDAAILTPTNDAPSISTPSEMTAANKEYHAVYATELTPSVNEYRLVNAISAEQTYVFVSANEAGAAYALPAKDMATSSTTPIDGVAVTISEENEVVKITTLNTDIEYYCTEIKLGGGDTLSLQVVEDNTKYLCLNGSGLDKRASNYKAFWDTNKGLYGTNSAGTKTYYIEAGETFSKLDDGTNPTNRVYAFEKTLIVPTYNAYVTKGYAVNIAATENGSVSADKAIACAGETVTLTLTPDAGYKVASVIVNGGDPLAVTENQATFEMPAAIANVVATFSVATALDNTEVDGKTVKVLRNGILYIEKNGHTYNAMGQLVK